MLSVSICWFNRENIVILKYIVDIIEKMAFSLQGRMWGVFCEVLQISGFSVQTISKVKRPPSNFIQQVNNVIYLVTGTCLKNGIYVLAKFCIQAFLFSKTSLCGHMLFVLIQHFIFQAKFCSILQKQCCHPVQRVCLQTWDVCLKRGLAAVA